MKGSRPIRVKTLFTGRDKQSSSQRIFNPLLWLILAASFVISSCQTIPKELPAEAKVTVLISDRSASENKLIRALKKRLGQRMSIYHARGNRRQDRRLIRQQSLASSGQVVAVGLRAAMLAKRIKNKSFNFCNIYNFKSAGLQGSRFSGISLVPDQDSVLWTVHSLNPLIKNLAVITGPGLNETIAYMKKAAAKQNIRILHRVVRTDKEFLYVANLLSKKVDAYWLLPDDRILSSTSIKVFMARSVKQGKQVVAFTPTLLKLGALVSVEPDVNATADLLHDLIRSDYYTNNKSGRGIHYVKKIKISISQLSAERFGIKIPKSLRRYKYE